LGIDTAVVVAVAAVAALGALVLAVRWSNARSERRFESVVRQLDEHMAAISLNLERAVERSEDTRRHGTGELSLTLDLADLLRRLVEEAARRTGAQAATVRVRGAADLPAIASFGTGDGSALHDATLGPPDGRPFRAVTLGWAYPPSLEGEDVAFRSALVVPLLEDGVETGALAVYARGAAAFGPEHARALEALAEDAAPGIANARRFAEAELRALTDQLTGVRNRRAYDEELHRELARARRTGRPVSLLLLDLDDFKEINARFDFPGGDLVLQEFADLLERVARATDTVCRRGGEEFAIILSETTRDEGATFDARLREEVAATSFSNIGALTFSSGLAEWRPTESPDSVDARASALVNQAKRAGKNRLEIDGG
jgi:diguanylate cyclase (GGDEF)-like protein